MCVYYYNDSAMSQLLEPFLTRRFNDFAGSADEWIRNLESLLARAMECAASRKPHWRVAAPLMVRALCCLPAELFHTHRNAVLKILWEQVARAKPGGAAGPRGLTLTRRRATSSAAQKMEAYKGYQVVSSINEPFGERGMCRDRW